MLLSKEKSGLLLIDVQTTLAPHVLEGERCIERCHWMMRLAQALDVPTMVCEQYPKGLGETVSPLNQPDLRQAHFSKVHFSCFKDDAIKHKIQSMPQTQWVLMGIETHVCVMQTAIDLVEAGYGVYVVVDAVSARNKQDSKYGLKRMKQHHVELVTSEMVYFEWVKQAGTAEFKTLSQTFFK